MGKFQIARQLSGRKVITNDGEDFGRLVDVNINELTGKIESMAVEPNPDSAVAGKMKKEDGNVLVNYDSVLAVGDYVIVDKRNLAAAY
ncbi:MAG: PRC-barrel domain-containing protein [Candidatus Bilamarchaeaceae archaeon]